MDISFWSSKFIYACFYSFFKENPQKILIMCYFRYVKVHDISDNYALVASISYPSPILAIDLSVGSMRKSKVQLAFTCSRLTIETLEQGVEYAQS